MTSVQFSAQNSVVFKNVVEGMSPSEILEAVKGINHTQIEYISMRIAQNVVRSLGPVNKARIDTFVENVKGKSVDFDEQLIRNRTLAEAQRAFQKEQSWFLDNENNNNFHEDLLKSIQGALTEAFSLPNLFCDKGHTFMLTEYFPRGLLRIAFEKQGLTHLLTDYPDHYEMMLKVDVTSTDKQKCLVLQLIQKCQEVEFENTTFPLPN